MVISLCVKNPVCAALSAQTCFTSSWQPCQEEKLTFYFQAVNYLLCTYATDDIIAKAYVNIIN